MKIFHFIFKFIFNNVFFSFIIEIFLNIKINSIIKTFLFKNHFYLPLQKIKFTSLKMYL